MTDEYLQLGEAARFLGVSRIKLGRLAKAGAIPFTTSGLDQRVKLFKRDDLVAYVASNPRAQKVS